MQGEDANILQTPFGELPDITYLTRCYNLKKQNMGTIWSEYVLCDFFYIFFSARLFTEELMEDGMSSYLPDGQSVMNPASSFYAIHSTRILCSAYYAPKIHLYCGGEISQCYLGRYGSS